MQVVDAEPLLQDASHEREPAGEDGGPIAEPAQGADEALRAVHQRHRVDDLLQRRLGHAAQQRHPLPEARPEVHLAAHGGFGDGGHLRADASVPGEFVDDLGANQRRIHVERDEPAVTAVRGVVLKRDVYPVTHRQREQVAAERRFVGQRPGGCQFDAHPRHFQGRTERHASGQAVDAVDVQPGAGDRTAHVRQVRCRQRRAQHRHEIPALALGGHPRLVVLFRGGGEAHLHAQLVGLEQQFGQERRRLHGVGELDEQPERERAVDHGLPDVEDARPGLGEDAGQGVGHTGAVGAGDVNLEHTGGREGGHAAH